MAEDSDDKTEVEKVPEKTEEEAQEAPEEPSPKPLEEQPELVGPLTPKEVEVSGGYVGVTFFRKYFGVSDTYVRQRIYDGTIKNVKTIGGCYRIPRSEIAKFENALKYEPRIVTPPVRQPKGETPAKKEETRRARSRRAGKPKPERKAESEDDDAYLED